MNGYLNNLTGCLHPSIIDGSQNFISVSVSVILFWLLSQLLVLGYGFALEDVLEDKPNGFLFLPYFSVKLALTDDSNAGGKSLTIGFV